MAGAGRNPSSLERMGLEGPPHLIESLVPTPLFSGLVGFNTPNAISFAPATAKFATPMTRGTLMANFAAEPQALRDWDDVFFTSSFTELVITVRADTPWSVSLSNLSTHSGPVSKMSGRSRWRTSLGAGTTSLVQN